MLIIACCTRFRCSFSVESWLVFSLWGHYKFKRNYLFLFMFKTKKEKRKQKYIPQIGCWWDDSILSQLAQSRSIDSFHSLKKMLNFERIPSSKKQPETQRLQYWRNILKIFRKHKSSISLSDCLEIRCSAFALSICFKSMPVVHTYRERPFELERMRSRLAPLKICSALKYK